MGIAAIDPVTQYWSNALIERRKRNRLATKAGLALGVGAGLLCALSPGTAFAVFKEVASNGDMKFGDAAGDGSLTGTVILDTSDGRTFVGGAYDMAPGTGLSGSFKLVFGGGGSNSYTCTLPASITLTSPGPAMTLDNFTTSAPLSGTGSGDLIITIGGSLHLAVGQTAGDYLGNLTMSCIEPPQ